MTHSATIISSPGGDAYNGAVFVTLVCDGGETDEVQLLQDDGNAPTFVGGEPLCLTLRTFDMGKVQTIKVWGGVGHRQAPRSISRYPKTIITRGMKYH